MIKKYIWFIYLPLLIANVYPCTTLGISTKDYIYLAKNRDMLLDRQKVMVFKPTKGNKFVALVSNMQNYNNKPVIKTDVIRAGINEKNLAIVNMSVKWSLSNEQFDLEDLYEDGSDFMSYILSNYSNVKSITKNMSKLIKKFKYPEFYMIADRLNIAYIEIDPKGNYAVKIANNEKLVHTNHYLIDVPFNEYDESRKSSSSFTRYKRATELVNNTNFGDINDIFTILNDRNDLVNYNNSIFRVNNPKTPHEGKTVSQFIVQIPKDQTNSAELFVNIINTSEEYQFTLDKKFWQFNNNKTISLQ